jgi:hypothetical protein
MNAGAPVPLTAAPLPDPAAPGLKSAAPAPGFFAPASARGASVVALVAATAWLAGNVLLVAIVGLLFAAAPPRGTEFSSHQAAGAVFGLALSRWYLLSGVGLLPPLLIALGAAVANRRRAAADLAAFALGVLAMACHLAGATLLARLNDLLVELRTQGAGGAGPGWDDFNRMHSQSQQCMELESAALLALAVLLAIRLARAPRQAAPAP